MSKRRERTVHRFDCIASDTLFYEYLHERIWADIDAALPA